MTAITSMSRINLLPTLFFLFFTLLPLATARKYASFCRCTCATNSTIIELKGDTTCNDCNRQMCMSYQLPICKGTKEEDITTLCFQRESTKDQVVVYGFIVCTAGLLVWALVRRAMRRNGQVRYQPVGGGEEPVRRAGDLGL